MHRNQTRSRSVIAFFSLASLMLAQQPTPPAFYRVDFIKTKPGKQTEYTDFLKKNVTAISQASIKSGKLMGWGFANVFTPTGTHQEHNLVGFYAYGNWENMEPSDGPPPEIDSTMKTLGFSSPQDYMAKRDVLRDIIRSEIWRRVSGTTPTEANAPKAGDWVIVSYLKTAPGKAADYDKVWKTYSLPILEDRAKNGKLKSYSMWSVLGGGGTESKYDRISLARYATFKEIGPNDDLNSEMDSIAERIHSGKDWRQMRRDMQSLRTMYRGEVIQIKTSVR